MIAKLFIDLGTVWVVFDDITIDEIISDEVVI